MKRTKSKKEGEIFDNIQNEEILSQLKTGFDEKLEYFVRKINEYYQTDPNFYLQRHEFNRLINLINKDSVYITESPQFIYNGLRFGVDKFSLEKHYNDLVQMNFIFIFHDIGRSENMGNMYVSGKIMM